MRMNYEPHHSQDHADSEYVSYVGIHRKGDEFIGNKHTQLYIISTGYYINKSVSNSSG